MDTNQITGASIITICSISFLWTLLSNRTLLLSNFSNTIIIDLFQKIISDWKIIPLLLYLGLFVTAIASNIEQNALKAITASETTLIYTLEPLTGVFFAVMLLNEHFGLNTIIGATLIITACIFSSFECNDDTIK